MYNDMYAYEGLTAVMAFDFDSVFGVLLYVIIRSALRAGIADRC